MTASPTNTICGHTAINITIERDDVAHRIGDLTYSEESAQGLLSVSKDHNESYTPLRSICNTLNIKTLN